jgi:hypothetical protein
MRIVLTILCAALLATVANGQVTCMSCDCNPALCDMTKPPPTDTGKGKKPKKSTTTTTSTVRGKGTAK